MYLSCLTDAPPVTTEWTGIADFVPQSNREARN